MMPKQPPWPVDSEQSLVIGQDDLFALGVRHRPTSTKPMYVTVLAIDPDMEIQAVLPQQQGVGLFDEQRLDPGGVRRGFSAGLLLETIVMPRWGSSRSMASWA